MRNRKGEIASVNIKGANRFSGLTIVCGRILYARAKIHRSVDREIGVAVLIAREYHAALFCA